MGNSAIYPGSFDPVTNGHIDLIHRATQIFTTVIVAVTDNPRKTPMFTIEERVDMLKKATKKMRGVRVESFGGLVINYAKKKKVNVLIRGLRMLSDFEYEFQMALTNRRLAGDIETVFLMPSESYSFTSSNLLKEAAFLGADISSFVPKFVEKSLKERLKT
ncbi:MAG: pantetheine-phosphate adenylyltransferase [Candidatus Omnitrophota bacterium]|nr:pantetheine-phosphate adenylyltransferase [Candidatus Omnitrophota bacterium]MDZ4241835.1 pantetheine-phosphate adenylyltransferase [Candidatus Omnitrophota bacterium]